MDKEAGTRVKDINTHREREIKAATTGGLLAAVEQRYTSVYHVDNNCGEAGGAGKK